jgi:glycine cleavage system H lipoate-binding protein
MNSNDIAKQKQRVRIFSLEENQCIWMKAGVVSYRLCDNGFDCTSCAFDKAMSKNVTHKPAVLVSWREVMRHKPFNERECRHMLTGRVQYKFCANNYQCSVCEFDQNLDEADLSVGTAPVHTGKISGFTVADSYYYHKGHSWARIEHGGFVRMGIDDFTVRMLGAPSNVRLPKLGTYLGQGKQGWTFEKEHKSAAMLSPMTGVVMATNQKVSREPELIKSDPFGEGWLIVVEPEGLRKNMKNLLFNQEAVKWLKAEAAKLEKMVMAGYGVPLAATGGEIVDDIASNVSHLHWEDFVREFLLT